MDSVDRKTLMQTGIISTALKTRAVARAFVGRVAPPADEPDGMPREFSIGARPLIVGAHRSAEVILQDPQVSRQHAELQAVPEGIRVKDLGSTNGTFWQGARVTEVVVPPGAQLRFGNTSVRFASAETPSIPPSKRHRFGGMVGQSFAMRELFAMLELCAPTDATVLLQGESGTGKEVAARALHDHSARAEVPLVVVDCSAISEALIDSHLFGHVKGSFTGALSDRKGAFVEASGGTLFLDEIGELPLAVQAKLLRALEDRTVQPVGSDHRVAIDTRVVAATHRDLARMVEEKTFRFDLYYRLAVVHVHLPPLRERTEDLAALITNFYEGRGLDPGPLDGDNLRRLEQYAWPGNVRELRNTLERAWALSPGGSTFETLRLWVQPSAANHAGAEVLSTSLPFAEAKERWNDHFEHRYLSTLFENHGRNITHTAEQTGLSRRHLRELLRKHGILTE